MPTGHYRFRRSFGNVGSRFRGARPDTYPLFTGLLDSYPGAAAAYSLRALTSNWLAGDVVEVRRSSDSTTQGFTASQITGGQMLDFVNNGTSDLYNSARYFNGTSMSVALNSNVTMSGDFSVTFKGSLTGSAPQVLAVAVGFAHRIRISSSTQIRIQIDANNYDYIVADAFDWTTLNVTRTGTNLELWLDGVSQGIKTSVTDDFLLGQFGLAGGEYANGVLYDINLNDQAAYTGLGTSVTAWEDTIGSNDGTESNGAAYTGQPYDGFVSTWYDQSGNGNDATQATTTAQPKIVDAGSLVTGGLDFDGVDDLMQGGALSLGIANFSSFSVATPSAVGAAAIVNMRESSGTGEAYFITPEVAIRCNAGITWVSSTPMTVSTQGLLTAVQATGNLHAGTSMWLDGSSVTRTSGGDGALVDAGGNVIIGASNTTGSNIYNGRIAELIVYNSDESANRTGIETSINDHYSIY